MQTINVIAVMVAAILVFEISNHLKLKKLMANDQEMLDLLIEADEQTNEIAADLQDLIDNGGTSPEVKAKLAEHVAKLKGVAATHTPGGTPPVEG